MSPDLFLCVSVQIHCTCSNHCSCSNSSCALCPLLCISVACLCERCNHFGYIMNVIIPYNVFWTMLLFKMNLNSSRQTFVTKYFWFHHTGARIFAQSVLLNNCIWTLDSVPSECVCLCQDYEKIFLQTIPDTVHSCAGEFPGPVGKDVRYILHVIQYQILLWCW